MSYESKIAELRQAVEANEPNSFGGIYGEQTPEFRVFVVLTGDAAATLAKYTRDPVFVPVQGKKSLNALEARRQTLERKLQKAGGFFSTDLDLKNGKIKVKHPDRAKAKKAIEEGGDVSDDVEILEESGQPTPIVDILGGKQITAAWTTSTTQYYERGSLGFNVTDGTTRGVLTAGHFLRCVDAAGVAKPGCTVNGPALYNPTNAVAPASTSPTLSFQAERLGGNYDFEWRTASGHTFPNLIDYGAQMRVTATYDATKLTPGTSVVCKMGKTTGYTCGTVTSVTENINWYGATGTYIRVRNNATGPMAGEGDSGGPVFQQNTALGLATYVWGTGQTNAGEMGFMPIGRISVLGLNVITTQ